jgi:DNA-binding transcriptional LysR family regulator
MNGRFRPNPSDPSQARAGTPSETTEELISTVDDLLLLAEVIEAGGFRAASESSGITKSLLSRRIAALELRLNVCVLRRDSRRFEVTEIGQQLYEQALKIREASRSAMTLAHDSVDEPSGLLRVACPFAISQLIVSRLGIEFAMTHPRVRLSLSTTKGMRDSLGEYFDLIVHPSAHPLPDSELVARRLMSQPYQLVAAPSLVKDLDVSGIASLQGLPAIGWNSHDAQAVWRLIGPGAKEHEVQMAVRFVADNLMVVRDAAVAGLGVARLPLSMCTEEVASNRLVVVAPGWAPPPFAIYALYPSRRRLSLAGHAFLAVLADALDAPNLHHVLAEDEAAA